QLDQVVGHPQLRARDRWRTIGTEHAPAEALLPPATFSDTEARMGDVPALGQHTRALLMESGLDAAAPDDAIRRGIAAVPVGDLGGGHDPGPGPEGWAWSEAMLADHRASTWPKRQ
ncbi:MAG TPA: hypothetical protein VJ371_16915, partial [Streptosporangiaceae bacterium]|nr:hypothetical protein [Streptosporangiaceae bacterium]